LEDFVAILFHKFENAKIELQMEAANVYTNVPFTKTTTAKTPRTSRHMMAVATATRRRRNSVPR
jgi:hypothetical protein